jgi:hypothetical protein
MRWRKLGRIFAPVEIGEWGVSHASLPVAWRLDSHRWRVYFSPRDRRGRSHTGFFEFDPRRPDRLLRLAERPALSPGGLGTFDEDGAMASWIVAVDGRLRLYYIGWNRGVTVPFRNAIGAAESRDGGESFTRLSDGPLLDRDVHDPYFTASPCVLVADGRWRLWYLSGVAWEPAPEGPRHRYLIKHADSADGLDWRRSDRVCVGFRSADEHALARPCVLREPGGYRMWYSRRGASYRIGYAESADGLDWRRLDDEAGIDVSPAGWDSEMVAYACVFDADGERYMLYNGNGYGATGVGLAVLERP